MASGLKETINSEKELMEFTITISTIPECTFGKVMGRKIVLEDHLDYNLFVHANMHATDNNSPLRYTVSDVRTGMNILQPSEQRATENEAIESVINKIETLAKSGISLSTLVRNTAERLGLNLNQGL